MKVSVLNRMGILLSTVMLAAAPLAVAGPLDDLDRGHRLLIEHGFQIQGLALDTTGLDLARWQESNFTTVNFWATPNPSYLGPAPGIPWARWFGGGPISPSVTLSAGELPYYDTLVSIQAGDEQDLEDPVVLQELADALALWRVEYPELIHVLSQVSTRMDSVAATLDTSRPDLLVSGVYTMNDNDSILGAPVARGGSQQKMYTRFQGVRETALAGHGGTGYEPMPFGYYTQTFTQDTDGDYALMISGSQLRLNHMAALAFGAKWLCAFVYNRPQDDDDYPFQPIFYQPDESAPTTRFYEQSELNAEILRLGPALVRVQTTDVRIVSGQHVDPVCVFFGGNPQNCVTNIPLPTGVPAWGPDAGPYIESIQAENLSGANDGLPGDVLVGYFEPLHEDFDGMGAEDEPYFMLVNSMAFQDRSTDETRQRIEVTFDFGASGINALERLSRFTGQVESVPLEPLGGSRYRLTLDYGGGEGDLFKFATGAPFIVADEPAAEPPSVTVSLVPSNATLYIAPGATLQLEAQVDGATGPIDYQWYRDLGPSIPGDAIQVKAAEGIGINDAVLTIPDMTDDDAGAYWCAVTTGGETFVSPVVQVAVAQPVPVAHPLGFVMLAAGIMAAGLLGSSRGPGRSRPRGWPLAPR